MIRIIQERDTSNHGTADIIRGDVIWGRLLVGSGVMGGYDWTWRMISVGKLQVLVVGVAFALECSRVGVITR